MEYHANQLKHSVLKWIGVLAGIATIVSAVASFVLWLLSMFPVFDTDDEFAPYPSRTGRLGASFEQGGKFLTAATDRGFFGGAITASYFHSIDLKKQPFSITLPRYFCDKQHDIADVGLYVRTMPSEHWHQLEFILGTNRSREFTSYFPNGSAMAAAPRSLTELGFHHETNKFPNGMEPWAGFHYFYGDRFAKIDEDYVTIHVNSIFNYASNDRPNLLLSETQIILVLGVRQAQCIKNGPIGIDFVRISFR